MANVSFTLAAALDAGVALAGTNVKALRQADRLALDAVEENKLNVQIEAFCSKSERHAQYYRRAFDKYTLVLKFDESKKA